MTTVSFVFNETGSVSEQTRERILRTAQEMGYRPHSVARALATRRTRTLGVLVDNIRAHNTVQLLCGLERAARKRGYRILLVLHDYNPGTALEPLQELVDLAADGLISLSARTGEHPELTEALMQTALPFVLGYYSAPVGIQADSVFPDNRHGGRLAAAHLWECGRTRFAYIGGNANRPATQERLAGMQEILRERGAIFPSENYLRFAAYEVSAGLEQMRTLIADCHANSLPLPDGVFAGDDNVAAGVLRACREQGLRVPEDISVVGFNDLPLALATDPPLTTVRMPLESIGAICVERLISRLEYPDVWQPVMLSEPCQLIRRAST
jgi:LacI family transcriptional regulator